MNSKRALALGLVTISIHLATVKISLSADRFTCPAATHFAYLGLAASQYEDHQMPTQTIAPKKPKAGDKAYAVWDIKSLGFSSSTPLAAHCTNLPESKMPGYRELASFSMPPTIKQCHSASEFDGKQYNFLSFSCGDESFQAPASDRADSTTSESAATEQQPTIIFTLLQNGKSCSGSIAGLTPVCKKQIYSGLFKNGYEVIGFTFAKVEGNNITTLPVLFGDQSQSHGHELHIKAPISSMKVGELVTKVTGFCVTDRKPFKPNGRGGLYAAVIRMECSGTTSDNQHFEAKFVADGSDPQITESGAQ